jgi:hypothetical protein
MKVVILITLVLLLVARRIQHSIGFQQYRQTTLTVRMVLFVLFALSLLSGGLVTPSLLIPNGIGIIAGLVLAYIATNHTQFEKRGEGLYFKTHIWVEIVVITLFVVRFSYRLYVMRDMFQPGQTELDPQTKIAYMHDSFTGFIFLTFCTYYIGYYSFILKEAKKALSQQ